MTLRPYFMTQNPESEGGLIDRPELLIWNTRGNIVGGSETCLRSRNSYFENQRPNRLEENSSLSGLSLNKARLFLFKQERKVFS